MAEAPRRAPSDEFFVGYLPAPPRHGAFVRSLAAALLVGAGALGGIIAALQTDPGTGSWHDDAQEFTGVLRADPYPTLDVYGDAGPAKSYLLVEEGKFGAGGRARAFDGRVVRVRGRLIERRGHALIELIPGDTAMEPTGDPLPAIEMILATREVRVTGQIVDPKCFLGVMKPGEGKPHRACAALCIIGGIPPVLIVEDPRAGPAACVLCDADGGALDPERIIAFIAEPVEIRGTLVVQPGGWPLLRVDAGAIRRR